jgi:integrase
MLSSESTSLSPASLGGVIVTIQARDDIDLLRRRQIASAVRVVGRVLGQPLTDIPADPRLLKARIAQITATSAGLNEANWRNVKSRFNAALTIVGASAMGRRSTAALLPEWRDLISRISDRYDRWKLSNFAHFCSDHGVSLEQVNDTVLTAFGEMLLNRSGVQRPKQVHRDAALTWNKKGEQIEGWPAVRLTVPSNKRTYALPLDAFPKSFATDLQAYLDHQKDTDLFGNDADPASEVTLRCHRTWLLEIASALVLSGRKISSIRSLKALVAVDTAKAALKFFWRRNGQRKSGQLHNFARLILSIARHWAKVPAKQLEALRKVRREVDPGRGEMTERNRTRLRAFDDQANVRRLINLPESIMRSVARLPKPGYNDAVHVQTAVAIALQLVAPLRAKNLASLELGRHIIHSRSGRGAVVHLVIPAGEVKNKKPLEFRLGSDVVRLLELYLKKFRPLLVTDGSSYLFPARQGRHKTPAQLADQIQRAIKRRIGLTVNVHLFRHFCAKLFLKAHPGEYETVRLLLGHSSLATTVRAYCGMERDDAVRRYDELLDGHRRPQGDEPDDR